MLPDLSSPARTLTGKPERRCDQKTGRDFSAEFGFHVSDPNYSGGLHFAGSHCKSASDLDLNFVAVGALSARLFSAGNRQGRAQHAVSLIKISHLPIREVQRDGAGFLFQSEFLDREVLPSRHWQSAESICFCSTPDIPEKQCRRPLIPPSFMAATRNAMRQEIVLALVAKSAKALGIDPEVST